MYSGFRSIWPLSSAGAETLRAPMPMPVAVDGEAVGLEGLGVDLGHELGFVEAVAMPTLIGGARAAPSRRARADNQREQRRPEGKRAGHPHGSFLHLRRIVPRWAAQP